MEDKIKIMLSSAVYGFEDKLRQIVVYLESFGYEVMCSSLGKMRVNPHKSNLENCLQAVDDCDIFIGFVRMTCGTGYIGDKNITYEEMARAIELEKTYWFMVEDNLVFARRIFKEGLQPKDPKISDIWTIIEGKNKHFFDPLSLKMYDMVARNDVPIEDRKGNWVQQFSTLDQITTFLGNQLSNQEYVKSLINM